MLETLTVSQLSMKFTSLIRHLHMRQPLAPVLNQINGVRYFFFNVLLTVYHRDVIF
jgi:hypothetical protein